MKLSSLALGLLALIISPTLQAQEKEFPKDPESSGPSVIPGRFLFRQAVNAVTVAAEGLGHPNRWPSPVQDAAGGVSAFAGGVAGYYASAVIANNILNLPPAVSLGSVVRPWWSRLGLGDMAARYGGWSPVDQQPIRVIRLNGSMPMAWAAFAMTAVALQGGSSKEVLIAGTSYGLSSLIVNAAIPGIVASSNPMGGAALLALNLGGTMALAEFFRWGLSELLQRRGKAPSSSAGGVAPQVERIGRSIPD